MAECKNGAVEVANRLHQENRIDYGDYTALMDGLGEIDTLRDRDDELETMWAQFADGPINPETECIEEQFMGWGPGVSREEIWHWFDERHSMGVGFLLYKVIPDFSMEVSHILYQSKLCHECESSSCAFNHKGICRFSMVHERKARITDLDGCIDYDYSEGEY